MSNKPMIDIHIHSSLKPYNNTTKNYIIDLWGYKPQDFHSLKKLNGQIRQTIDELAKDSQSNLDKCIKANLRTLFLALYPVERQMFDPKPQTPFRFLFKILLPRRKYKYLGSAVSGFPVEKVKAIIKKYNTTAVKNGIDYYHKELLKEMKYLEDQMNTSSKKFPDYKFRIARNFEEYSEFISQEKTIVAIFTIEGAHSFGHYLHNNTFKKVDNLDEEEQKILRDSFEQNINDLKVNHPEHVPFYITFCHHFNNLLAGHSRSFSDKSRFFKFLKWWHKPGMRHIFYQAPFLDKGFSELGWDVLLQLMSRKSKSDPDKKVKRILIDTKHMSLSVRKKFYEHVKKINDSGKDWIPVINSHAAVSGNESLNAAEIINDDLFSNVNQYFNRFRINATDEDILATYESDGIMGLVMHDGRMPGDIIKEQTKKLRKEYNKIKKDCKSFPCPELEPIIQKLKPFYCGLFLSNIFHILKVIRDHKQANGWKILALGSDYDGLVDPFNAYYDVTEFPDFRNDLIDYFKQGKTIYHATEVSHKEFTSDELNTLLFGESIEERLDEMFSTNMKVFLSKYFTEKYLIEGIIPNPTIID